MDKEQAIIIVCQEALRTARNMEFHNLEDARKLLGALHTLMGTMGDVVGKITYSGRRNEIETTTYLIQTL